MTLTRAVQCDLTWTEDRAPVRTDPSAAPRAETEGRAVTRRSAALPSLRDRHQCDKPLRQDAATALGTMPRLRPLRQAHLIPVHGEPRHQPRMPQSQVITVCGRRHCSNWFRGLVIIGNLFGRRSMTRGSVRPGRLATSHDAICPSSRRRSSCKVAGGVRLAESSIHAERMYWQAAVKLICRGCLPWIAAAPRPQTQSNSDR